jgi:hypothetical protein
MAFDDLEASVADTGVTGPNGRDLFAMAEKPTATGRIVRHLDEFTTGRELMRIRATLWREAGLGDRWWVPRGWHPDPAWVAVMDLHRVHGIGRTTRKVIGRWLEANGM